MTITDSGVLAAAMGHTLSEEDYERLAPAFADAMRAAFIDTPERAAMWCAQLGHESVGLKYMEEIADGSAYEGRADLGNHYPGDGVRFKGRGPIQVTGRYNYELVSQWSYSRGLVPHNHFFVDNPAELASEKYGFIGPVWYWIVNNLNGYADNYDIRGATIRINGGLNGFGDRKQRYDYCLAMGDQLLPGDFVTKEQMDEIVRRITSYVEGYLWPVVSDTKDNRQQLTGGRNLVFKEDNDGDVIDGKASYPGWKQLNGLTVVDALAAIGEELGMKGFGGDSD